MSRLTDYFRSIPAFAAAKDPAYPWDQWAYTDYFYHETPEMLARYKPLTGLACRGACIAIGEWIAVRLDAASQVTTARAYFDAAWVTMIRHRSCVYAELAHADWAGPLDGVLRAAMLIVNDTVFEAEEDFDFAERLCWSVNLARHIADETDRDPFERWLSAVTDRLLATHSGPVVSAPSIFDRTFSFGPPVGPGIFILGEAYQPAQDLAEIARIANNGMGRNPYLRLTEAV